METTKFNDKMETTKSKLPTSLIEVLQKFRANTEGRLIVLTGAGISAESGIPTFRGKEGYWTVGSTEYQPEEMATHNMFMRQPEAVWSWYLYRRGVCLAAQPNAGHQAVFRLEELLRDRFLLITQNVDGLHLRTGNSLSRTYQIHGNLHYARCLKDCGAPMLPLPLDWPNKAKGAMLTEIEQKWLHCKQCGSWLRPHVLWFDECYDEEKYYFYSSLQAASEASLLIVVGTSGATNLPLQIGRAALAAGAAVVDVNPMPNPFADFARQSPKGFFLQGFSGSYLPLIVEAIEKH